MSAARAAVIGIDPGTTSAAALLTVEPAPRVIATVTHAFDKKTSGTASATVRTLCSAAVLNELLVLGVWIEGQYLGINPRSLIVLARTAGRWQEAAETNDLHCHIVEPVTWQARELPAWRVIGDTKRAAIGRVAGIYRMTVSEHVADAILIARYAAITEYTARRQGKLL